MLHALSGSSDSCWPIACRSGRALNQISPGCHCDAAPGGRKMAPGDVRGPKQGRQVMKDQVHRVEYFALTTDDRPGVGADLGARLAKESVNLLALLAFPLTAGKVQVDLVPEDPEKFTRAAKKLNLTTGSPKQVFVVQSTDRAKALGEVLDQLGKTRINVRTTAGVCADGHRYGALIWVAPADVESATRALGATTIAAKR